MVGDCYYICGIITLKPVHLSSVCGVNGVCGSETVLVPCFFGTRTHRWSGLVQTALFLGCRKAGFVVCDARSRRADLLVGCLLLLL